MYRYSHRDTYTQGRIFQRAGKGGQAFRKVMYTDRQSREEPHSHEGFFFPCSGTIPHLFEAVRLMRVDDIGDKPVDQPYEDNAAEESNFL